MQHLHFLYQLPMTVICLATVVLALAFNQLGYKWGQSLKRQTVDDDKSLTSGIQGSILGLLALMLGFTFSMALQHFDSRSEAVLQESNAIGTAQLRATLLPPEHREKAAQLFASYVALRVTMGRYDVTKTTTRGALGTELLALQNQLWNVAVESTQLDPSPSTSGAFSASLTEMFDAQTTRGAILLRYVPDLIITFLVFVFCMASMNMGYSAGLSGRRVFIPSLLVILLITSIFYISLDIDRPRRGFIQVNQDLMKVLQQPATTTVVNVLP